MTQPEQSIESLIREAASNPSPISAKHAADAAIDEVAALRASVKGLTGQVTRVEALLTTREERLRLRLVDPATAAEADRTRRQLAELVNVRAALAPAAEKEIK